MPYGEPTYSFITPYPDMLQRGRAQRVKMRVERSEAVVAVTEAGSTFTLYSPDGVAVVNAAPVSVSGGIPYYDLAADLLSEYECGPGWMEVWKLVLPDETVPTVDREAAVTHIPLQPPAGLSDLERRLPRLDALHGDDVPDLQNFFDEAWSDILGRILAGGELPQRLKSGWVFRVALLELAAALFFDWLDIRQPNQGWGTKATEARGRYKDAYDSATSTTDRDEDGRVEDPYSRDGVSGTSVTMNGAPLDHGHHVPLPRWA